MDNMIGIIKDLLDLRTVRNSCRKYMTRNQNYISVFKQFIWYLTVLRPRTKKGLMEWYLWYNSEGEPIGYGLLNIEGDQEWISGGVIPEYRKLGWGKEIFSTLISSCRKIPHLEVLKTNKPAIKLYESLGFKIIKKNKCILVMRYE